MKNTRVLCLAAIVAVFAVSQVKHASPLREITYPPVNESDGRTPLYFALIQSFGQYISIYSMVGLEVALDFINADETLLPGYSLHYVYTDVLCDTKAALNAFHHQVFEEPTKIGVIGCGCSVSTEPVATISHYYNLVQMSCVASSAAFRNRNLFPRYFQLLTTEASLATAYLATIKHYGWERVALIVQDERIFTVAIDKLKNSLFESGIQYTEETLVIVEDGAVDGLSKSTFDENSRIFIVATYEPIARQVLCEAYKQGYMYPRYLFFTIFWYTEEWWKKDIEQYGCTERQMEELLQYSMSLEIQPYGRFSEPSLRTDTVGGLTVEEYYNLENQYVGRPPLNLSRADVISPTCYDGMWTFAYALNRTIAEFESNTTLSELANNLVENETLRSHPFRLENFSYKNNIVMETFFKHMENTDFNGVTGNVAFGENGIREVSVFFLFQYRKKENGGLDQAVVGRINANLTVVYEPGESVNSIWPLGVPYDGVNVNEEVVAVHLSLTVILTILSCAGIIFSIVCLVFNFYFRNQTLIRLTSPNLNYLIGSGAILLYIAIILTVLPAKSALFAGILCNLREWLTGFGYSLCYGTILVKMWRVYYIFSNPSAQKKSLHDWKLALMVLCFVVIDLVMLVVFSAVEGSKGKLGADRVSDDESHTIEEGYQGIPREFFVYICSSRARDIFLGVFYGYKALLQFCGIFLAFATRKVKVKGLDDAKWIAATIYITSIVLAITLLSSYTLSGFKNRFTIVFTIGLFIGTSFIMAFVFVSKMVQLCQDPEGTKVFERAGPTAPSTQPKLSAEQQQESFDAINKNGSQF